MRSSELDKGILPEADDTWWSDMSPDERLEVYPLRYYQESWNETLADAASQIEQEKARMTRIQAEKQPKHAGQRSFAGGVLALLRKGARIPRHRAERDL
jgi:hypothetical protein